MQEKQFYDHGWNARVIDEPYDPKAKLDWRDGWKDCDSAEESVRELME